SFPPIHPLPRAHERTDQPWPDRALMIGAVAVVRIAFVSPAILWIGGREAAQSVRRQQMLLDNAQDTFRLVIGDHRVSQTHGKYLVRTNGTIATIAVDYIVKTAGRFVPEQRQEAALGA